MRRAIALTFVLGTCLLTGCGPDQRIIESANKERAEREAIIANSNSAVSSFEQDLEAMRTADFKFIYVIRRKDGAVLDADDKKFLSGVVPTEINRRTVSDGGKAVLLGSNFRLSADLLKVLKERFAYEDYSQVKDGEETNSKPQTANNANSNQ